MRALLLIAVFAGTAAADAPVAGPPAGGKPAPTQPPTGKIAIVGRQAYDDTTLSVDMINAKVNSVYMTGLKRCYNERLKRSPNARGRMVLRFSVTDRGHMDRVETHGFDTDLDECVRGAAQHWTFAIPKDKTDKAVQASFAFDLAFD
jgi:hypothetical protein